MECSICYNEITSATGKVELSCEHPFHFSCLTKWFDRQKLQGACENCPLCRHESNEFEKMPADLEEDEESEDEDDSDEEEEPTLEELAAQERARILFDKLKFFNPIEEVQLYAANKIKACWRGYQDRLLYIDLLSNKEDADYGKSVIEENKRILLELENRQKFLKSIMGLSRIQVKKVAATKLQSLMRGHVIRRVIKEGPKQVELKGSWNQIGSMQWQRVIMNPEEDKASTVFLHPLSTRI
jgi:hypothetical protein